MIYYIYTQYIIYNMNTLLPDARYRYVLTSYANILGNYNLTIVQIRTKLIHDYTI